MHKTFSLRHAEYSDAAFNIFTSNAKQIQFGKNETLLTPGRKVNKLFFIESGFLRGYRIIDGNDITHHFFIENWFATDYQSYLTGATSELFIETILPTTVLMIRKEKMDVLFREHHEFESLGRVLAEDAYLQMVERLKDFQTKELKERYLTLINKNPLLFNLVSQKHIASYLGVAPQSLSRIKSNNSDT